MLFVEGQPSLARYGHTRYIISKRRVLFFSSFSHWLVAIIYCATSTIGFHTQGSSYSSDAFVRSAMILYSHIALYNVLLQYHLSECNRVCWLFFFFSFTEYNEASYRLRLIQTVQRFFSSWQFLTRMYSFLLVFFVYHSCN